MRFVRTQIVETTVFDQELNDQQAILSLLNTLQKSSAYITLEYRDSRTKSVRRNDQVRVKQVDKDSITITIFTRQGNLTVKGITFDNIISIKLSADIHNIELGKEISRFDFLDL